MTSGNVSDEPIAYRDDDAVARLSAIADLLLLHDRPIETRTDDSVVRVVAAPEPRPLFLRRSRGYVPAAIAAARWHAAAAAGLRRRAQEHVLPGQGRARVGLPPHRRPRELRDAALVHRGDRALPAAVRGRARDRRPRPAPRVPVDQVRARARRGRRADRRPASPRAPGGVPGRARRVRDRDRRDLRRHRLRDRRHRLGRRAAASATWRGFERVGHAAGACGCPAARAAIREPWRMACAWLAVGVGGRPGDARDAARTGAIERVWRQVASCPGAARARRRRPASGGCSTRSRRCAACAPRSTTRVRRRSSSRPPVTRVSAGATRSQCPRPVTAGW